MVLVTGSTGLLGSHVVVNLLANGYAVRAMYRSESRKTRVLNLMKMLHPNEADSLLENLSWVKGNVCDIVDVDDALNQIDTVVHCAALVSFSPSDFRQMFRINRKGTENMVNFASKHQVKHFIHVSSTAAVGSDSVLNDGIQRESNKWNHNDEVSGYSLSKYAAEREVWRAHEEGLPMSIINPSIMFGPGSWNESSLAIFRTLKNGLNYYTKGSNAFVNVSDVARFVHELIKKGPTGERYLITGTNSSFKSLFDEISTQMNVKSPSVLASNLMTNLAWRLSAFLSFFTGKRPTITRESARSAHKTTVYSNEKLLSDFPHFVFTPLETTIHQTIVGRLDD